MNGVFISFKTNCSGKYLLKTGTSLVEVKSIKDNSIELMGSVYMSDYDTNKKLGIGLIIDAETKLNVGIFIVKKVSSEIGCVWFTGLSGSGKTTSANMISNSYSIKPILLDGDNVRKGISSDLDLSEFGRYENIRRIAEIAKLMINQGYRVIVAAISKDVKSRKIAKKILGDSVVEIYVNSSNETREKRDTKGLYANGVNMLSDYEISDYPFIEINTNEATESDSLNELQLKLKQWKNT